VRDGVNPPNNPTILLVGSRQKVPNCFDASSASQTLQMGNIHIVSSSMHSHFPCTPRNDKPYWLLVKKGGYAIHPHTFSIGGVKIKAVKVGFEGYQILFLTTWDYGWEYTFLSLWFSTMWKSLTNQLRGI
jgi:hypothetical protein